jgi:WD40 repeat protein
MREIEVEAGEPIWDLVAEFLERRERGDPVDAEAFIQEHADVASRLREALAGFQWMEAKARPGHASMEEVLPRSFGNYELLRVVGRGGMGCVYEAFHRPLKRHVAVKALPPHLTNVREFRLRFLREARVIASLHHTHIAPVFEVGQIGNTLYLAMPFIDGPNLRELVLPLPDDHPVITKALRSRLPAPFTAAYFRWVADIGVQAGDALAHAHVHGVIHRDVKPSNLLIDEHGQIWIVDFGLAKAPTHPTVTQPGELIGTLRYASPEQVRGEAFDKRSDIYSLGVTLYELLTRRPAFPPGPGNQVLNLEPLRPRRVHGRVPRDLETIVMRAMAKQPRDRYRSADELADDLRRFLRGEPIRARPIGWVGRLVRWSRRNPAVTGVAAGAAVLLAGFAAFHWWRENEHRAVHTIEAGISAERQFSYLLLTASNTINTGHPGRKRLALEIIREAAQIRFRDDLWDLAIRAIDQVDMDAPIDLTQPDRPIQRIMVSPDGNGILAVEPSGPMAFWNNSGGEPWTSNGFGEPLLSLAWSPDGVYLAGGSDRHVWLGRVDRVHRAIEDIRVLAYESAAVAFHPNGRQLALRGNTLRVWDIAQGQFVGERPSNDQAAARVGPPAYRLATWSPDGSLLAAVPEAESTVEFWNMPGGERLPSIGIVVEEANPRFSGPALSSLVFTPDGSKIACGCSDGTIRFYERTFGAWQQTLRGHETPVRWLEFFTSSLPSEKPGMAAPMVWLVSADDQDVRLWDVQRDQNLATLARDIDGVQSASVDARGTMLALSDRTGKAHAWHMPNRTRHQVLAPERQRISTLVTSPQERRMAWADEQGHVVVRDADLRNAAIGFDTDLTDVELAFGPGGRVLAIAGYGDPPIRLYSTDTGESRPLASGKPPVNAIAFLNAGQRLAALHAGGRLIVWNTETGEPFATVESGFLRCLTASRDGKWLAAGDANGDLHLWNAATMSRSFVTEAHPTEITTLAFAPDGQSITSASRDGLICRWRLPELTRDLHFEGPGGAVVGLAYCLDGSTLAMCGGDGRVLLWASGRSGRIGSLSGLSTARFDRLATTADGRTLIAAGRPKQPSSSAQGGVELWDIEAIHRAVIEAQLPDWRDSVTRPSPLAP